MEGFKISRTVTLAELIGVVLLCGAAWVNTKMDIESVKIRVQLHEQTNVEMKQDIKDVLKAVNEINVKLEQKKDREDIKTK